ncbi:GPW/gp25 family protein [Serratia marcescens]|uniref:GPW/gp25 family protein n=1 Tax=Serratia marcescens TaxID=615 RepID=UPI0002B8748C|nr:GPW/gp25 family protein [Serratia marcescens]EMF07047.1 gpW/GP25 family protein [Serratia marcescens VGH107]
MTASLLSRLSDNQPLREEDDDTWALPPHDTLLNELKMLLMSRARLPGIEENPLLNASILNYGIEEESPRKNNETNSRRLGLETRLKNTILRFEPRLSQMSLTSNIDDEHAFRFILRGVYSDTPIVLELTWDDYIGRFCFNE